MRRFIFTLICALALTLGMAVPVAGTGLTLVTLRCTNGTNLSAQVDADTLAGLVDAVQGMALFPAGVTCTLIQAPLLVAIGGVASASPDGGFIVGSGRFKADCSTAPFTYWVNFAITAETQSRAAGSVAGGGSVNFTIPSNQCVAGGSVASTPTCLAINADQPKPPAGNWYAYLLSRVTGSSGSLASSFPVGSSFGSGWKDTGNPAKQTSSDRVALDYGGSCPQVGSPNPDGGSFAVVNGNVTINVAR
jgi:hypothetical protein